MKLFFVLTVAASTVLLLVQGAPQVTSQELGKAVEQLQEMIKSEAAKLANHPREQNYDRHGAQKFTSVQKERVTAQVRGVDIRNCGTTGTILNSALAVLNIYADRFGVLVDCQVSPGCVQVRVDAPADDVVADVDVCDLGNGQACVQVNVEPTTTCRGLIPITIPIPLANGQQILIEILVDPVIPFFNSQECATVRVNAPQCPQTGK